VLFRSRAFSWEGDYSNLDDIIDAVKHGHSIDWSDVRRKQWSQSYITDGPRLCRLLSSCRNPGACLKNIQPANLRNLLRTSSSETALQLAQHILHECCHQGVAGAENPLYTAMWIKLVHDPKVSEVKHLLALVNSRDVVDEYDGTLTIQEQNVLDGMLWAREHAMDMRKTSCSPSSLRDDLLVQTLVFLSWSLSKIETEKAKQHLAKLWSGAFAALLRLPSADGGRTWSRLYDQTQEQVLKDVPLELPSQVLRRILTQSEAFEEAWQPQLSATWRLLHCRSQGQQANDLWSDECAKLLFFECGSGDGEAKKLNSDVFFGLLHITCGALDRDLQRHMLTSCSKVPPGVSAEVLSRMTSTALPTLKKHELRIDCVDSAFLQVLQQQIPE